MKSTINFYYNLFPEKIYEQGDFFYFWILNDKYYFVPFKNDKDVVLTIYEKLLYEKKKVNKLILNKAGELITSYKNSDYALFMVDCIESDIVNFNEFYNIIYHTKAVDWGTIWERKIDYLEYQVSQRALGKDNILNSFSYYVGLGENAIQYYNLIDKKDAAIGIQHKRVYAENYSINYYNPLNMIFDYNIRDIAEYIKFSFFNDKLNFNNVIKYINELNLNSIMINLLYVRLLFPTYYFDHYEKFINDEEDEKIILNIINKTSEYEKLLQNFYLYYGNKYNLIRIEWLF